MCLRAKDFHLKDGVFMQTKGNKFVYDGDDFIFKGFGLGNVYLFEPFMISFPGTDQNIKKAFKRKFGEEKCDQFFNALYENYISEKDIKYIKSLGANFVRLPFSYTHFFDDTNPYELKESGFAIFDRIVGLCKKYDLLVIFDLHNAPGSQNRDVHGSCDNGSAMFWDFRVLQDTVINMWTAIADRYKDCSVVAGYDVLNEPVYVPDAAVFSKFYVDLISAIRTVDKKHVIFLEGDEWAKNYSKFDLSGLWIADDADDLNSLNAAKTLTPNDALANLAWSYHLYPVNVLNDYNDTEWNPIHFRDEINKIVSTLPYDFPIWCGETGLHVSLEKDDIPSDFLTESSTFPMIVDALDILDDLGHSWSIWTYKDCCAMGLVRPKSGNAWFEHINKNVYAFAKNAEHNALNAELINKIVEFFDLESDGRNTVKTDPDNLSMQTEYMVVCATEKIASQLAEQKVWNKIFDGTNSIYAGDFDKMTAELTGAWHFDNCIHVTCIEDVVKSHF